MNTLSSLLEFIGNEIEAQRERITVSTTTPTNDDGNDGDIWLVYDAGEEE